MKKLVLLAAILVAGFSLGSAQTPTPAPTPVPVPPPSRVLNTGRNDQYTIEQLGNGRRVNSAMVRQSVLKNIENLYRKPTSKEMKLLTPNRDELKKFSAFLGNPDTGIVKLAADFGCAENSNIVVASPDCLKYSMPGAGSSYSFRVNNYRIRRLADLTFSNNSFQATGVLLHGILVDIGNVSLDQISLDTKGLRFINDFVPTGDYAKGLEIDKQLLEGVEKEGFLYRRAVAAKPNTTYILRSIAYRGNFYRAIQGFMYDELDFDRRKDIIVAFRIIRTDDDGSVTILWKELESKKSPTIKKQNQKNPELDENKFIAERLTIK